jgi:hypothetical protein
MPLHTLQAAAAPALKSCACIAWVSHAHYVEKHCSEPEARKQIADAALIALWGLDSYFLCFDYFLSLCGLPICFIMRRVATRISYGEEIQTAGLQW